MYACMYVICMCKCMYVCKYVCKHVHMFEYVDLYKSDLCIFMYIIKRQPREPALYIFLFIVYIDLYLKKII